MTDRASADRLRDALRLAEERARDHDDLATAYNLLADAVRAALRSSESDSGIDALVREYVEAEGAIYDHDNPSPTGEQWNRVLRARQALREYARLSTPRLR